MPLSYGGVKMSDNKDKYHQISMALILAMIGIYLINYTAIFKFINSSLLNYWIIPGIWLGIVLLIVFKLPKIHGAGKSKWQSTVYMWAFNCGVAFILVNLLGGMIEGFGKSPYSHSLRGILSNLAFVGVALVGREFIRTYLINTYGKRNSSLMIGLVIILMTLTEINVFKLADLKTFQSVAIFFAEQLLPTLSENILATYLVGYGGAGASIIYLGMGEAFEWLSPILPNLDWLAKGVIGMAVPLVCLMIVSSHYLKLTKQVKVYKVKEESLWQWGPTVLVSILLIWFTVGVFPVYPSAIATGSMQPMIDPGDVVLVKKAQSMEDLRALQIGDVIQFKRGDILINHRIVDILEQEDGLSLYQTKGDNNSVIDSELVKMEDVKGTIVGVIPKIGWPTLIFKSDNPEILKEVEF